jgi:hypothetical protein
MRRSPHTTHSRSRTFRVRGFTTVTLAAATSVAVFALAGCSSPEPSNLATPEVVWPSGDPFGSFADDPAVQASFLASVNYTIARNARDFSDPDFVGYWGVDFAQRQTELMEWKLQREQDLTDLTDMGPDPYLVMDVVKNGTQTTLVLCDRGGGVEGYDEPQSVVALTYEVSPDGSVTRSAIPDLPPDAKTKAEYDEQCQAATVPVGYFDPAPVPNMDRDAKVKGPAAASKYDLE